jgi:anthranilate phosphoribosyltransferase
VLEALGVNISAEPARVEKCVDEAGLGFMFAQLFNKSMGFVGQARKELGVRTVFNILGPLANPSRAKYMVVGVYDSKITEKIATVLSRLGVERAFVMSGYDNMDEFTITGETVVSEIDHGTVKTYTVTPEQFGFSRCSLNDLKGGDGSKNAEITKAVLSGETGPKRDIVLLNAGAALYIGGMADSIQTGIGMAAKSIDSGKAEHVLEKLVEMSN